MSKHLTMIYGIAISTMGMVVGSDVTHSSLTVILIELGVLATIVVAGGLALRRYTARSAVDNLFKLVEAVEKEQAKKAKPSLAMQKVQEASEAAKDLIQAIGNVPNA